MKQELTREEITKIQSEPLQRSMSISREMNLDEENRTVELAFSSSEPVPHWFGHLILDHNESSIRLNRLRETGALLWAHDHRIQIGAVESVSIDSDKNGDGKCRAVVKFSESECGEENFQDVKAGIKRSVSFGFLIYSLEAEPGADGKQMEIDGEYVYRSRDWEPFEVSLVSIPADPSVGVGRNLFTGEGGTNQNAQTERVISKTQEKRKMAKENENGNQPGKETEAPAATVQNAEITRANDFAAFGKVFGEEDLARDLALKKDATIDDLREAIRAKREASTVKVPPLPPKAAAARQNGGIIQPATSVRRYAGLKNFKGEDAEEKAYRFGQWFMGGPLGLDRAAQFCRDHGIALQRGQVESVNEKGGFLVPEEFGNDLIDLREQFGVFRRNAKIIPMVSDSRTDPRRIGGLEAYFDGEGQTGTESEKLWDRVGLTAKKLKVMARISSEVNEDSVINMADDLIGEIAYAFAKKEDRCGFLGDGSASFGGIVGVTQRLKNLGTIANTAGLKVGSGNAYSELTLADFEETVALLPEYADSPMAKWFVNRSFYFKVMVKLLLASGGVTAAEVESGRSKKFLGYDVEFAQCMPKAEANSQVCAVFGDLSKAASLGSRRDTTIALSEHSRFSEDEIEIKGTERFDINVHSVGNNTSTEADKEAGPVVGLITAAS